MNLNEQMELARKYNKAYRTGVELISDAGYDILLSKIQAELNQIEFWEFISTLSEEAGTVKTNYVLGSLTKIKFEEPEKLYKWMKKENINNLFISEKIDGVSFEANYRNGKFVSCASKGDGDSGTDWTEKGKNILPQTIACLDDVDIRGEFTLTGDTYKQLGYKNRRAGTIGIMNRDEVSQEVKYVEAFAYQILSSDMPIRIQFTLLNTQGFKTPSYTIEYGDGIDEYTHDVLKSLYLKWKADSVYDIDGVVLCGLNTVNENDEFLPKKQIAFKVNSEGIETEVLGIEWELSKGRLLKPVLLLNPIEVDGVTISRCTAYNAKYVFDNNLFEGAIVKIIRSGEVIPRVVDIVKGAPEENISMFLDCPICGIETKWYGVELQCSNESCGEIKRVEHFIKQSDIENVSEKRLAGWGIYTFDALLEWNADPNSKSQREFYNELLEKVFHVSSVQIMRNFSYDGFGQTLFDKLLASCDTLEMMNLVFGNVYSYLNFLTEGIGARTIEKAADDWKKNWEIQLEIISDSRYDYNEPAEVPRTEVKQSNLTGKTFLLTGTLSRGRTEIEKEIVSLGGKIASSVSKNLDYLLVGDKAGSKLDKARKIPSITILTEADYSNLI